MSSGFGLDHAVARPDGRRGARDGAPRPVAAAPDRRRDDVEAAHGGEDRAAVLAAGRARARRVARRRRSCRRCSIRRAGRRSTRRTASCRTACASCTPSATASRCSPLSDARANPEAVPFDELATPDFTGVRIVEPSLETLRAVHRLAVLLPHVGAEGPLPGDPRAARGEGALRRRAGAARRDRPRRTAHAREVSTASGPRRPTATISLSTMTTERASASFASSRRTATRGRTAASPTTSRPQATTSARSRSPPASASRS